MHCGGIVLCGGRSSRMGRPKLSLPFGPELMLPRVVRILGEAVAPIVVVAARDQDVPDLPAGVRLVRDEHDNLGPLAGLAAGLASLPDADAAYVTACDTPLLTAAFVRFLMARLGDREIAVVREAGFVHPLAGVYRTFLAPRVRQLLDSGQRRPLALIQQSNAAYVESDELREVDPTLNALRNTNTPEELAAALRIAGFASPI